MTEFPDYVLQISMADYRYDLPEDRIAERPAGMRDAGRLLRFSADEGNLDHLRFSDLPSLIPAGATLILNNTKVVRARLFLYRETGGRVEAFLVDPVEPSTDPAIALGAKGETTWHCLVGGLKKIRNGGEVGVDFRLDEDGKGERGRLRARLTGEDGEGVRLTFRWSPEELSFADVIERVGHVPLPPYIKRDDRPADVESYQTVYAEHEGAVAAPTAGLHFTPELLDKLQGQGVNVVPVTLHVGAGTFAPVKEDRAAAHSMHSERIHVSREALRRLIAAADRRAEGGHPLVLVGTTSLRTVESLYWFGVKLAWNEIEPSSSELSVNQWDPYRLTAESRELPSVSAAFRAVERWCDATNRESVDGPTRLMILPGYRVAACDALITNFHQPGSTLILLVAAFLGDDNWRRVYHAALESDYRFLSYGDSSLLIGKGATFQAAGGANGLPTGSRETR